MNNISPENLSNIKLELTSPIHNNKVTRLVFSNGETHVTLVGEDAIWKRRFSRHSFYDANQIVSSWSIFDGVNESFAEIKEALFEKKYIIESACSREDAFYIANQQPVDMKVVSLEIELLSLIEHFLS